MGLSLKDLLVLADKSYGKEYILNTKEQESLKILGDRLHKHISLLKPLLKESQSGLKLLLFDVETDPEDRDKVLLVGVMAFPELKIWHFDHRLSRSEVDTLTQDGEVVVFSGFNYGFDLVRAFSDDAKEGMLRRSTRFGDRIVSYYIYRAPGVISYALDTMRLASNLLSDTKRGLAAQSETNVYFQKLETSDFTDKKYNAYDLLSSFELLVRCSEKAEDFLGTLGFKPAQIIDFVLKVHRYEILESHIAPLKFFESGSRIAKMLIAPYAKFPSIPAMYMGGRVRAFKTGHFQNYAYLDVNSEYPSIMSRLSPGKMKLVFGEDARALASSMLDLIREVGAVEAFHRLYVDQKQPTFLLSTVILAVFTEDATWLTECLKEKTKRAKKLSPFTTIYRNRREEQSRAEGLVEFKQGHTYQFPAYFLFLQSHEQLKRIKILKAAGLQFEKDDEWSKKWDDLYRLRKSNPVLGTSFKIAMNSVSGLMSDVDQFFSNLALGSHVTAFSRTVSFLVQKQLEDALIYVDTDGFIVEGDRGDELQDLLCRLAPWGAKREYADGKELIIFRTKRYAIHMADGSWVIKGAERSGYGREKNRILSFLSNSERMVENDIRQATKQVKTPNIPAVRKLLKDSESGEWCFYFSYPLWEHSKLDRKSDKWYSVVSELVEELESESSGEILEDRFNKDFSKLAEWSGFTKKPSRSMSRSRWFLEWFEWLRAYGVSTKQDIYDLVRRKTKVDLEVVEARVSTSTFRPEWENRLVSNDEERVVSEVTRNGRCYMACRVKERLIEIAEKMPPLPSARLTFESSKMDEGIPDTIFSPLLGKPDTTFLEGQISQASILHVMLPLNEKMRLISQAVGMLGKSDNLGVKLKVETLKTCKGKKGELEKCVPELQPLPRRSRKHSPFSQRRFYVEQRFPYRVRYHVGIDAVRDTQYDRKRFVFAEPPSWLPEALVETIACFMSDVELLEQRLGDAISKTISESSNLAVKMVCDKNVKLHVVPYARYKRFDVAYDIPHHMIKDKINEFQEICERDRYDYRRGLGYVGLNGRKVTNSVHYVPGNIVLYDRNARFDLRENSFLRRYSPFVESWQNEKVGRLEIQCFASRSNNRKANPFASMLNILEMYRLQAPAVFQFVSDILSVLTHMLQDPPAGSGLTGANLLNSNPIESNQIDSALFGKESWLAGLGLVT